MKKILFSFIFFIGFTPLISSQSIDTTSLYKQLEFYKRLNEINSKMIMYELKKDSIDNIAFQRYTRSTEYIIDSLNYIMLDKYNIIESKRKVEIKKLKFKNFILVVGLASCIVLLSFLQ